MAIGPGTRIGAYEVVSPLGAGGMGEVFRARDTRLNRDVALEVLRDVFANDPERLAWFEREAQALAALKHPHIATIHGIEESDGVRAGLAKMAETGSSTSQLGRSLDVTGTQFSFEPPVELFTPPTVLGATQPPSYDVTADGRFMVIQWTDAQALSMKVIVNGLSPRASVEP